MMVLNSLQAFCSWATKVQLVRLDEGANEDADAEVFGTKRARSQEPNEPNKRAKQI
jgi:hypothetical protein